MEIIGLLRDLGIFGLAMWFIQHLLSKSADRKFESYKTELNYKTQEFKSLLDSKLELYKVELNLQNYKATQVYEKQLSIIIDLYRKLTQLNQETAVLQVCIMKSIGESNAEEYKQEERKQVAKQSVVYDDFSSFYRDNLIFIPQKTVEKIDDIRMYFTQYFSDYVSRRGTDNDFTLPEVQNQIQKTITETKQAIDLLNLDFKRLLGVEML